MEKLSESERTVMVLYIPRSQQPYSLDAQSEPTIEIVDASIALDIQSKSDLHEV